MSRETSRSYTRPHRPAAVALANQVGALAARVGLEARLDEASLVAAARRRTGLHFFGDEALRTRLRAATRESIGNYAPERIYGRIEELLKEAAQ